MSRPPNLRNAAHGRQPAARRTDDRQGGHAEAEGDPTALHAGREADERREGRERRQAEGAGGVARPSSDRRIQARRRGRGVGQGPDPHAAHDARRLGAVGIGRAACRRGVGSSTVEARTVTISQGGLGAAHADQVDVRQGGIGRVEATDVALSQGGIGIARADRISVEMGGIGVAIASDARVSQGFVRNVLARDLRFEQGLIGTAITGRATFERTECGHAAGRAQRRRQRQGAHGLAWRDRVWRRGGPRDRLAAAPLIRGAPTGSSAFGQLIGRGYTREPATGHRIGAPP